MSSSVSARLEQIFVPARQHKLSFLVEDGDCCGDDAVFSLTRKIDNLERRIQRISSVDFLKELAREFCEGNKGLADVMGKERRSWRREGKYL